MPIPAGIENLSVTPASNNPAGSENVSEGDDHLRNAYAFIRQSFTAGSDIASASTITPPSTGGSFNLTGTTTVTAIATTNSWSGRKVRFRHTGAHSFTQSASLVCPGGASITFANGDISEWAQNPSGGWEICWFLAASGDLTGKNFYNKVGASAVNYAGGLSNSDGGVIVCYASNGASPGAILFYSNTVLNTPIQRGSLSGAGNWVFLPPTSGVTLTATAVAGAVAAVINGVSGQNIMTLAGASTVFATSYAGDTVARGVAVCKFKAADTSRVSTTTLTNDPDLAYTIPGAGTYEFEAYVKLTGAASNTGIGSNINYSGTFTANASGWVSIRCFNGGIATDTETGVSATVNNNLRSGVVLSISAINDYALFKGTLTATGAGTLAFAWAQNTNSANSSTARAGSYLKVTQLS